jgi:hypothetical protein
MHIIPGLSLRRPKKTEDEETVRHPDDHIEGLDEVDLNELAYDYVHVDKEIVVPPPNIPVHARSASRGGGYVTPRERPTSMVSMGGTPNPYMPGSAMPFQQFVGQQQPTMNQQQQVQQGAAIGNANGQIPSSSRTTNAVNQRRPPTRERDNRISLD